MGRDAKTGQIRRFQEELDRCTQCGYCTFWCPLYQEEPAETSAARGKVKAIRDLLASHGECSEQVSREVNRCMLCMTCAEHCPAKTRAPDVVLAARADRVEAGGLRFPYSLVFRHLVPRPGLFGNLVRLASWIQWAFMPRTEGTIRHLAFFLSALGRGRRIPEIAPRFFSQVAQEKNRPRGGLPTRMRVGYFVGCTTNFVFPRLGAKVVDFLTKNGVEVVIPHEQGCCGAPVFLGAGDFETGRRMADRTVRAFEDLDVVVCACATCASALKDYAKFLADNGEREERYRAFARKVREVSQFLVDVLDLPPSAYRPAPYVAGKKVTWHDSCHLNRYLGVKQQPRQIIASMEGVEYREMVRPDWCCGMAGTFSVYYYEMSKKIADRKIASIRETNADIVATGCPGCMIQLIDNTSRHRLPVKVMHVMELLE